MLAADEVWRLQGGLDQGKYRAAGGDDPECICFQEMSSKGHYGPGGGTKQGIYVCTPSGEFLASVNSLSPQAVRKTLQQGLEAWADLSETERNAKPAKFVPDHRWEWSYPKNGLALKATIRHLPANAMNPDSTENQKKLPVNFDFVWFSAEEARQFVADSIVVGKKYKLPDALYHRLGRHHLLNNARGESGSYAKTELIGGMHVQVLAADDQRIRLKITGQSRAIADKARVNADTHWRSRRIDATIFGLASFDREKQRFTEFELMAKGLIFENADEKKPDNATPIGWHFALADPTKPTERLPPTHLYAYEGEWVEQPRVASRFLSISPEKQTKSKSNDE